MKYIIIAIILCILLTSCIGYKAPAYQDQAPKPVTIDNDAQEAQVTVDVADDLDSVVTDLEDIEEIVN